ncbi:GNAT family N-acetyltransferase [Pseudomonas sp. DWP3-1-2]|uniref:GNAT family N-acetyltransferase n=1 Tax=Pseudomonas sp. DWP3-1-2 TaxID=2804645 RepID=UPI003CF5BA11
MNQNLDTTSSAFPIFHLDNYDLRKIQAKDIHTIFAGLSHPDVIAHYGVSYQSLEATQEQMHWYEQLLLERKGIWWGIARRDNDELVGACGLNDWRPDDHRIDLGYWLLPDYWRRGIMQRGLPHILRYAFVHMNIHRVHADVEPENLASFQLLRKLGFVHEGTLRDVEYKGGRYLSLHQLSLIKTDPGVVALVQGAI